MSKQLLNLTLHVVMEEIENILATYPKYPYQQVFSKSELRYDLIAYVMTSVPNKYAVVEETQSFSNLRLFTLYSTERILNREHWIHIGIRDVLDIYNRSKCCMTQTASFKPITPSLVSII